MESINQITENARINLAKAADNSLGNITEKTNKLIDGIIKEPLGGAHSQVDEMHQITKTEIKKHLAKLMPMNAEKRSEKRIAKFCAMGVVIEENEIAN